jgi:hypothetical protein
MHTLTHVSFSTLIHISRSEADVYKVPGVSTRTSRFMHNLNSRIVQSRAKLWQQYPKAMKSALYRHDSILREAVGVWDKSQVDETHTMREDPLGARWVPDGLAIASLNLTGEHEMTPLVKDAQWPSWGK